MSSETSDHSVASRRGNLRDLAEDPPIEGPCKTSSFFTLFGLTMPNSSEATKDGKASVRCPISSRREA